MNSITASQFPEAQNNHCSVFHGRWRHILGLLHSLNTYFKNRRQPGQMRLAHDVSNQMSIQKQLTLGKYLLCKAPKVSSRACSLSAFSEQALALPPTVVHSPKGVWTACPVDKDVTTVWWLRPVQQEAFLCLSSHHLNPRPLRVIPLIFQKMLRAPPGSSVSSGPLPCFFLFNYSY